MRRNIRKFSLAVVAMFALAACGGEGETAGTDSSDSVNTAERVEVTVGVIPIVDVAPIYLGEKNGIFEKHNIDLSLEQATGGAALMPGVISGDYQFGFSNNASLVIAESQGLDVNIIAEGVSTTGDPNADFQNVVAAQDSNIERPSDLESKKVAINNMKNINEVVIRYAIEQDGGDPMNVEFVELGFPEIPAAVDGGRVDAGQVVEPFLTSALDLSLEPLGITYAAVMEDFSASSYFTSGDFQESDPEVVENFQNAMKESLRYATDNPDEVRAILSEYTSISEEVAAEIILPRWSEELSVESVERLAELMERYEIIDGPIDVHELIPAD